MVSLQRLLIMITYVLALIAVTVIFQHEINVGEMSDESYRHKLVKGTSYVRSRLAYLQEKAKELFQRVDSIYSSEFVFES